MPSLRRRNRPAQQVLFRQQIESATCARILVDGAVHRSRSAHRERPRAPLQVDEIERSAHAFAPLLTKFLGRFSMKASKASL